MNNKKETANQINILLVDDNPNNLRLLSDMLSQHGYQTRRLISGKMVSQAAKANNFDLILLDINMPDMNGYQVCQQIKADPQTENIPVIFISALNETLDKVTAFKVGAADYISKPFELEEVIARVENQVKIVNLQKKLQNLNLNLENKVQERTKQLQVANQDLKKVQQKLFNKSLKDPITNLDNKISFMGKFRQAIELIKTKPDYCFALFVFDCFCPQLINEIFDLKLEDSITISMSQRLYSAVSAARTMARLEGNEFVVIIDNMRSLDQATAIAEKIKAKLNAPLSLGGQELKIEAHYGIELGIKYSAQSEYILNNARTITRKAKYKSYCDLERISEASAPSKKLTNNPQKIDFAPANDYSVVTELEKAFKREEITLLYQPIISLKNKQIKELEVSLYWSKHKKIISLSELENIIAKKTELGLLILQWMIKQACRYLKNWQEMIIWTENLNHIDEDIKIRFKLLEQQLLVPNFIKQISKITGSVEIDRKNIILEIPETFFQKDLNLAQEISQKLSLLGFNLSINDLSIKSLILNSQDIFSFNNLNIDNLLLNKIDKPRLRKEIIEQIFNLAHNLNMTVTVNNIATSQQLKLWKRLGCDFANGSFFSEPVKSQEIANLIQNNSKILNILEDI